MYDFPVHSLKTVQTSMPSEPADPAQSLLKTACAALERTSRKVKARASVGSTRSDNKVLLQFSDGQTIVLSAVIRMTPGAVDAELRRLLQEHARTTSDPVVIVAPWVSPVAASSLIDAGIQFMDTAGNAYIDNDGKTIVVLGNARPAGQSARPASKAVTPRGLSVGFTLLTDANALNLPLRQIAALAGTALSTANEVVVDLQKNGLIAIDRQGHRSLLDKRRAMQEWMSNYATRLRPKLETRRFTAKAPGWWRAVDLAPSSALFGGETAAELLTGALKARNVTLYCRSASVRHVVKAGKLSASETGEIEIIEPFWPDSVIPCSDLNRSVVHPLLICADLNRTGDSRNLEAANDIYEKFLTRS
jgi:hypothetical protein